MAATILVIEDDGALLELITYNLTAAGHRIEAATSAEEGQLLLAEQTFDAVVLDWMLPGQSGIELCATLRRSARTRALPILMLTARGDEADKVRGLTTGADDYVVKPFSVPELVARVNALLRRAVPERVSSVLMRGAITMDRDAHRVTSRGRHVELGPTEYKLLETLLEASGRVLSRSQLIDRIWGNTAEIDERTVDVHVGRLRKALTGGDDADPIRTVRGSGYVLRDEAD